MGIYIRLVEYGSSSEKEKAFIVDSNKHKVHQNSFEKIPGSPIAYWANQKVFEIFRMSNSFSDVCEFKTGITTGDNTIFFRNWFEVSFKIIQFDSVPSSCPLSKWIPCRSGSDFRKWYGSNIDIVNWEKDGLEIKSFYGEDGKLKSTIRNVDYHFEKGITWSKISSNSVSVRYSQRGFLFDAVGLSGFSEEKILKIILSILNTKIANYFISLFNSSMSVLVSDIGKIPLPYIYRFLEISNDNFICFIDKLIQMGRSDWDSHESSWDFKQLRIMNYELRKINKLEEIYNIWCLTENPDILEFPETNVWNWQEL